MTKYCACKGIRSCLICKPHYGMDKQQYEPGVVYEYCPRCKRAWTKTVNLKSKTCSHEGYSIDFPGITVIYDFISEKQEKEIVQSIDGVPWVSSQSGRRKQDYGPKVNFKKQKVKTATFTGLPRFSESLIQSMTSIDILHDFDVVELCNLEYIPERGAAIDPHKDDEWLWGERLVTLNLLSDTRYTMTFDSELDCGTVIPCVLVKTLPSGVVVTTKEKSLVGNGGTGELDGPTCEVNISEPINSQSTVENGGSKNDQPPMATGHPINGTGDSSVIYAQPVVDSGQPINEPQPVISQSVTGLPLILNGHLPAELNPVLDQSNHSNTSTTSSEQLNTQDSSALSTRLDPAQDNGADNPTPVSSLRAIQMNNNEYLKGQTGVNLNDVEVEIAFPRRALIVLSGAARTDWKHGIKSVDINARRIGITMRELTSLFKEGGDLEHIGREVLEKAKSFQGISVREFELQQNRTQNSF